MSPEGPTTTAAHPPGGFANEPHADLRDAGERDRLAAALSELDGRLPLSVGVLVSGETREGPAMLRSVDPGDTGRTVAEAAVASGEDVDRAVALAGRCGWRDVPVDERAAILHRAAGLLRGDRRALAALAVRECAKPWAEADADVCEAIDFLEYYAGAAAAVERGPRLVQVPGERNAMRYRPRGVAAVVAPWNFPFAIAAGMTSAALATGNAVCLKPAEQSPACAAALVRAFHAAGVPGDALALLPGDGEVGAMLVRHPAVHVVAFTGSAAVGLDIVRAVTERADERRHVTSVVAEMGGKNCAIVDADADLDVAVPAIVRSAFAFAGQKCSAVSRVLVHDRIAPVLAERLAGAIDTLRVGPADTFGTDVPPVIDEESRDRLEAAVAALSGRVVRGVVPPDAGPTGLFVAPALAIGPEADDPLLGRELFGPVLTVEAVPDLDAACALVDALPQALTGGLFSRDPEVIARVARRTPVGNLYVNRATTGAMVGRQPFGGNRLSGTGAKAGGADYLLRFVEPVVVTESTVRHGLAFG